MLVCVVQVLSKGAALASLNDDYDVDIYFFHDSSLTEDRCCVMMFSDGQSE